VKDALAALELVVRGDVEGFAGSELCRTAREGRKKVNRGEDCAEAIRDWEVLAVQNDRCRF
jgi:hypothetical protein